MEPVGLMIRKMRLSREMTLRAMARLLGISAAFVSAIETGKKAPPAEVLFEIQRRLHLSATERHELDIALGKRRRTLTIKLSDNDEATSQLALAFARRLPALSEDQKRLIQEMLE